MEISKIAGLDLSPFYNTETSNINELVNKGTLGSEEIKEDGNVFASILESAMNNISTTNDYLSQAEAAEISFALGENESTHDLVIAMQKASTSLQYTVAVRDKMLEAYNTIMQIQI